MIQGKVYLIGGGPGDIGLITVKGLGCLKKADVVVYDNLIADGLLDYARPDAEMIYVGKSGKIHAKEQHEINQILVDKAKENKVVARLKGSDPLVLGRGGEEAEELFNNNIPFEIVPGISSSIAVPAYAGIPVTHRNIASSFAVVTGHEDPTKETSSIHWDKLATGVDTLIFLMGMGNLPKIVEKLIECGRAADTPVALIRQGTTMQQQTLTGTLETIVKEAAEVNFQAPVVIVVGEVVALREKLAWFENRPLYGKRVLVTRARAQASVLTNILAERGAEPVELPAIEIKDLKNTDELDRAISNLPEYQWIIFTSVNGVDAVWKRLRALNIDARWFRNIKLGAIGPATAEELENHGLYADFMPEEYTSEGILSGLASMDIKDCRILLPRADIAPNDLPDGLIGLGAKPEAVTAYFTELPAGGIEKGKAMLLNGQIDIITFTSSSTVTNLLKVLDGDLSALGKAKTACIGPITAATAKEAGLMVDIMAREQTIQGLVDAIESYFR